MTGEMEPQSTEWAEWLREPMTVRFMQLLIEMRREILESWAAGAYTTSEGTGTVQLNAEAVGRASELFQLLRMQSDEYRDMEEHFGTSASRS